MRSLWFKQWSQAARPVLAGWLTAVLFLLQAAAVSPDFHHWLHDETEGANHDCAAILLQKGLAEAAPSMAALTPPVFSTDVAPDLVLPTSGNLDLALPPGRAPPPA